MSWYIEWTIIDWTSCRLDYCIGVKKRSPRWCLEMSVDKEWGGHRSESGSPSCQHQTALPSLFYEIWLGVREIVKFTKEIVRQTTQSKEMDYRDAVVKSLQCHFVTTVVNFHQNRTICQINIFYRSSPLLNSLPRPRLLCHESSILSWKSFLFSFGARADAESSFWKSEIFSLVFSFLFRHTRQILSGRPAILGR